MNLKFCWLLLAAILVQRALSIPTAATEAADEDDDDWDEDEDSSEADDDSRIYKNPRNSPSTECPRDEEQATLLGQKCLRKCSSDEDCKSKKKKCLCDGACGMSCIKPDRECPELNKPALGTITISGRHFGGRASYTCPHGYHVVGLQSRLCQADGQWAGAEPACKQNIYCLTPPTIEHARHSALPEQATFDLDSAVQYHCHTGFVTNGFPRAKCLAIGGQASWYGPDINCEPRSCGVPTELANGWHSGECNTFGCRVTYHCAEGHEIVGKNERFCQADGSWAPKEMPTCVLVTAVQCAIPENPKNGKAIYTSCSYNSVVSYECKYGFTLVGESSRRCGADRKWNGQLPVCKEINCGHPGVLYNGWLENIESGTGLGASIIYRCHPGMMLVGNASTVCQIDGRWRYNVPQCLAPCVVPTVQQGSVIPTSPDAEENSTVTEAPSLSNETNAPIISLFSTKVQHGYFLKVECEKHYEFPLTSQAPPTCNNGTWSVIPKCIPARCKSLPKPPRSGMVLAPKTDHGMKARFKCKDGFNLTTPAGNPITDPNEYVLTCLFGNWTGETPMCQEVYCSFPGYINHGKVLLVGNMGLYDYRPYVKKIVNNKQIMYDCDKGYVLGEGAPGATCVGGLWRPTELPECLPGQHPRLRWNRRRRRSVPLELRFRRSQFLLRNYRFLERRLREIALEEQQQREHDLQKRSIDLEAEAMYNAANTYRGRPFPSINYLLGNRMRRPVNQYRRRIVRNVDNQLIEDPTSVQLNTNLPDEELQLNPVVMEQSYTKYLDIIKNKYYNYVRTLLGYDRDNMTSSKKVRVQDGRWLHPANTLDTFTRYRIMHKARTMGNELNEESNESDLDSDARDNYVTNMLDIDVIAPSPGPISVPNIYENLPQYETKLVNPKENNTMFMNNTFNRSYPLTNRPKSVRYPDGSNTYSKEKPLDQSSKRSNMTTIIEQLKSQIVRKKRDFNYHLISRPKQTRTKRATKDEIISRKNAKHRAMSMKNSTEDGEDFKLGIPKGPCEPLKHDDYETFEIVRPGRDPDTEFSAGTIVKVTCGKDLKLNLQNPNATTKCVRSRWKPVKPQCLSQPCSIPTTEHGAFFSSNQNLSTGDLKFTPSKLEPFDEVTHNEVVTLNCDEGFNVQGPQELKCQQGNWAVSSYPECIPAPCVLPTISNAVYQGGYRGGLTIAHLSSVTVQCENPANNLPVQMTCALGVLSPSTIHCGTGARRSREEYLGEAEFVSSPNAFNGINSINVNPDTTIARPHIDNGRHCGLPVREDEFLVYKNEEHAEEEEPPQNQQPLQNHEPEEEEEEDEDDEDGFPSGTEITFNCILSTAGERSTWKIICEDGAWIGRSLNCANGTCIFKNNEPNLISFYNDLEIREELVEFPPGATITSRCVDIGKFAMTGDDTQQCIHSEWSGEKPRCAGLNQENDYAMEKAPTVLFRHQNGPIAQSNNGKMIVYPGTTVHMECLWMRRFGNPKWNVSHDYRSYPEGWVTEEGRDTTLEYRLSIFHAVEEDSGIFTCQTPARHDHSVDIVVKAVHCPEIPNRRGLMFSTNDTKMSTRVQLSCANGNSLIGASELVCMPSGNWSAPLPVCESVECGDIPITTNGSSPRVAVLSREVGGRAAFSCPSGFGLRGPSESVCMPSGEWATPFPSCVEVQCENPGAPQNGYAQGSAPYRAGDVVQFNCNPEYMMQGQPIIACQDSGRWSGGMPKCVQACSYPGTAISGRMSSVKFYYAIGESITFTCDPGLDIRGAKMLKCLRNGKWSNAIPTCVHTETNAERDAKGMVKRAILEN